MRKRPTYVVIVLGVLAGVIALIIVGAQPDKPYSATFAPTATPKPTSTPFIQYTNGTTFTGRELVDFCNSQRIIRQDLKDTYKSSFAKVEPDMAKVDEVCTSIGH